MTWPLQLMARKCINKSFLVVNYRVLVGNCLETTTIRITHSISHIVDPHNKSMHDIIVMFA